jgi:hypothetical protein
VSFLPHGVGIAPLAGGGVTSPGHDARMQLRFVSCGGLFVARVKPRPGRASGVSRQCHHAKQEHADALPNAIHDALPLFIGHGILQRSCGRHYTAPAHGCLVRISILDRRDNTIPSCATSTLGPCTKQLTTLRRDNRWSPARKCWDLTAIAKRILAVCRFCCRRYHRTQRNKYNGEVSLRDVESGPRIPMRGSSQWSIFDS